MSMHKVTQGAEILTALSATWRRVANKERNAHAVRVLRFKRYCQPKNPAVDLASPKVVYFLKWNFGTLGLVSYKNFSLQTRSIFNFYKF